MVELSTFLEKTPPDKRLEPISNDDLLVVEVSVGVQILLGIEKSVLKDWLYIFTCIWQIIFILINSTVNLKADVFNNKRRTN